MASDSATAYAKRHLSVGHGDFGPQVVLDLGVESLRGPEYSTFPPEYLADAVAAVATMLDAFLAEARAEPAPPTARALSDYPAIADSGEGI